MSWWERYQVDLPDGEFVHNGHTWTLTREKMTEQELGPFGGVSTQEFFMGRGLKPGTYTFLREDGQIWMSDTFTEIAEHLEPIRHIDGTTKRPAAASLLIGGLGLGMLLRHAITTGVKQITVVEINDAVLNLVAPTYITMARDLDVELEIVHGDLLSYKPKGGYWDVAWFDIWHSITSDNLPEMATLKRRFATRTGWQGCWQQEGCRWQRDRESRLYW